MKKAFEEAQFAEISKAGKRFKVQTIYKKLVTKKIVELLDKFLEKHTTVETLFVVCRDLNINILTKDYKNVTQSNGFKLFETSPTRVTMSSMSCIYQIVQQICVSP